MRKVALRGLLAHKVRMIMTLAAVALGVAFVAGVLTLTDTMQHSFDNLFATVYEDVDAVVRSDDAIDTGFGPEGGEVRGTMDEAVLDEVRSVSTVDEASGEVEGFAQIVDPDGDAASGGTFGGPTFVASVDPDTIGEDEGSDLTQFGVREGRWPEADDEVVVDVATEERLDYSIGDTVPILTQAGLGEYTLVGTVSFGDSDSAAGQSIVLFTTAEAQRTVGEPGRLTSISVIATDGTSQEQVVSDIRSAVGGEGAEVITGDEAVEEAQSSLREQLSFLTIILLAFAGVAVVVGAFVIYNSFSIIVAQRSREMALLRAVGATRKQVRRAVVVEAIATGLIGSALGFGLGLVLASLITGFLDVEGGLAILPGSVIVAFVVGMTVTVASSVLPAWRASRVPPVAAMRDVAIDTTGRSLVRLILGAIILALGTLAIFSSAFAGEVSGVGMGVFLALVGLVFLAPILARPVGRVLGSPLRRFLGITGSLAQQNAVRNPRRTASTGLALMIGVGIVAFFLILNASMRSSFEKIVDDNFASDLVVQASGEGLLGLPEEVALDVAELPEVDNVTQLRFTQATSEDDNVLVTGTSPTLFDAFGYEVEGSSGLARGQTVISDTTAESEGLEIGDTIPVDFLDRGSATLEVAGIYEERPGIGFGKYLVGLEEFNDYVTSTADQMIMIDLVPEASVEEAREPIQAAVSAVAPTAEVQDNEDLKDEVAGQLDVLLRVVMGMLLFSIGIAGFGIMNTVALSVLERTRELGLLRAVGMSRGQLRAAIRWESVVIALFGTTLGMAVGLLGGWSMVTALQDEGFEVFSVPILWLVLLILLAGVLGVAAALWPAWRASRLDVLDAIHHE